jgi:RNA polymerase sigma factor (TIGR02999 family)
MKTLSVEQSQSLLSTLGDGERSAASRWLPEVYDSLRALAAQYFRNVGPQSVLQPTALVHEAFVRLNDKSNSYWNGKTHFAATAARAMRFALVNCIRDARAAKRGGVARRLTLVGTLIQDRETAVEFVALNDLLETLFARSERQARIVELRVFGGLTIEETADVLGVSPSTVKTDWTVACAWLKAQL